jgi:restriction system protein
MTIPSYQDIMLPLLHVLGDAGKELHLKECSQRVADAMGLTDEQRQARLPSGAQTYVHNRTGWAGWYMQQAQLVEKVKRGHLNISKEGQKLLATNPKTIDNKVLAAYPSFVEKVLKSAEDSTKGEINLTPPSEQTPTEQIEQALQKLNDTLASDLLDLMAKMDPYKFEQLVIDLLFGMGYGGSRAEAALVTQKSNDEGIDGIINEDRLGLDVIYVQAKRWQSTVGRAEVQNFVGALVGKHATKGIFITTSDFHKNATEYAKTVQHKVILIGGKRLAELMIEYNVGVSTVRTIAMKRVDSDYFEE